MMALNIQDRIEIDPNIVFTVSESAWPETPRSATRLRKIYATKEQALARSPVDFEVGVAPDAVQEAVYPAEWNAQTAKLNATRVANALTELKHVAEARAAARRTSATPATNRAIVEIARRDNLENQFETMNGYKPGLADQLADVPLGKLLKEAQQLRR